MSTATERVVLNLLDAGWSCVGVDFSTEDGTVSLVIRTPPILASDSPEYARLIAHALGAKEPPP